LAPFYDTLVLNRECDIFKGYEFYSAVWHADTTIMDGVFSLKVYWKTMGEVGIYFRAYDPTNYYVLKVDPSDKGNSIKLWKNSNGLMVLISITFIVSREELLFHHRYMVHL
jgi:hypothetical protein